VALSDNSNYPDTLDPLITYTQQDQLNSFKLLEFSDTEERDVVDLTIITVDREALGSKLLSEQKSELQVSRAVLLKKSKKCERSHASQTRDPASTICPPGLARCENDRLYPTVDCQSAR